MPEAGANCTIRLAKPDEAELLSALASRSKAYWGYTDDFMAACRDELSYTAEQLIAPQYAFYVCSIDECIVGFYALLQLTADTVELEALFVEPSHIGHGFGRQLIKHAKDSARRNGASSLVIQGDPNARDFYLAADAVHSGSRESKSISGRQLPVFTIDLEQHEDQEQG